VPTPTEPEISQSDHDPRDLVYQVRVEVVGVLLDRTTGEVVAIGPEAEMKKLYRTLKRRK
jgi:hypothetical protein